MAEIEGTSEGHLVLLKQGLLESVAQGHVEIFF